MKNNYKLRLSALLLALVTAFACAVPAYAENDDSHVIVKRSYITNLTNGIPSRTSISTASSPR